jgi:hypothetical protein
MVLLLNYSSSNQQQSQADPLSLLPSLLILEDPTAFLTKYVGELQLMREIQKEQVKALQLMCEIQKEQVEALQLMREIQKEQAEARREVEAEKLSQAKIETDKCNRLIAIVLKHAKSKGINVPYLKGESYNDLCDYINNHLPELSDLI